MIDLICYALLGVVVAYQAGRIMRLKVELAEAEAARDLARTQRSEAWQARDAIASRAKTIAKDAGQLWREFLAVLLVAASSSAAIAQQVATPPNDTRPFLSIFTHGTYANIPHEAELVRAFDTDPSLLKIRSQCRYKHYTETDPLYRDRFAKLIPLDRLPAILLQRNDGAYVYKATASNVPDSPLDIFDEMSHFAKLDPLNGPADSVEARPYSAWQIIQQSGLDGIPDVDGPPSDCPDGRCPVPSYPDATPQADPTGGLLPDSAELLPGRTPIRNMGAAVVFLVGLVLLVGGGLLFFLILTVVVYLLAKVAK
jgi:hypothetical protein